ncbi:hypothetical protein ACIQF6_00605 [Kitasatospora sp. NPDC092948]|uniref:hypothetical protein n=1 Tax=Kitasatospora sp. NPDC092948 TaxID=3364088 RepID=UPI0037F13D1A
MNAWINLNAIWKIVAVGLLTGAGLPALFALALRLLHPPAVLSRPGVDQPTAGPAARALAGLLLAVVLAAIGWGISVIVDHR